MTIRLREEPAPAINYFAEIPPEIMCHILGSCNLKNIAPEYLSKVARICKVWNLLIHDVTVELLNKGAIRLIHLPFVYISKNPYIKAYRIGLYLNFLNAKISLEKIKRESTNQLCPLFKQKETFQLRKLTHLDLTDLKYFDKWLLERVKASFPNIETVIRGQCSFKDTAILPKFTGVKTLNISPNYNTDLSFIPTLVKLKNLSLHIISKPILERALDALTKTTLITSLSLSTCVRPYLEFPEGFCLPDQLKNLSLRGFEFSSEILNKTSDVERIEFTNAYLKKPTSFESLEKLNHLTLHISEKITNLAINNLRLDYFELRVVSLEKLTMDNCVINEFKSICPLLEDNSNDDTIT